MAWAWPGVLVALTLTLLSYQTLTLALLTIELRVDRLNAVSYRPSSVTCCYSNQCTCSTKLRACAFHQSATTCPHNQLQEGSSLGGLVVGRTPSVLSIKTNVTSTSLGLRVQLTYGPLRGHGEVVLGQFWLDLSELPVGKNEDLVGWATFTLDSQSGVTALLQVKTYCARSFYGSACQRHCQSEANRYTCDEEGRRVCLGRRTGPDCSTVDPCLSFPCLNEGTCLAHGDSFTCTCNAHYTGKLCALGLDSCSTAPCHASSTCVDLVSGFRCLCPLERTGTFCQTELSDCRKFGCQNGGACNLDLSTQTFSCLCPVGFHGNRCQTPTCRPDACQNGGTCRETGNGTYVCLCRHGYEGRHCQTPTSCRLNPCQNGGRCFADFDGGYVCRCVGPYSGDRCAAYDPCAASVSPCGDRGRCITLRDAVRGHRCECHTGFVGELCQQMDPCLPNPCLHSGICSTGPSTSRENEKNPSTSRESVAARGLDFSCTCVNGRHGHRCEHLDPCSSNPCQNGGVCQGQRSANNATVSSPSSYMCRCPQGHSGSTCSVVVSCQSRPCRNGGRCYAEGATYFCRCSPPFSGRNCQSKSKCLANPCRNGGSCFESSSSFMCKCVTGYSGRFCEVRTLTSGACSRKPCWNSGKCVKVDNSFTCECRSGFGGDFCERASNTSCQDRVCLNGGSCFVHGLVASCVCPSGFMGDVCQRPDPCHPPCSTPGGCRGNSSSIASTKSPCGDHGMCQPCSGGGSCGRGGRRFLCTCHVGYLGDQCDVTDPCVAHSGACRSGGTCVPIPALGTFTCICPSGRRSKDCGLISPCLSNPCLNNGICSYKSPRQRAGALPPQHHHHHHHDHDDQDYVCSCPPGFMGRHCDLIDNCFVIPCLNGGTCESRVSGSEIRVRCQCPPGFQGDKCQSAAPCPQALCDDAKRCTSSPLNNGHRCTCHDGSLGVQACLNGGRCVSDSSGRSSCRCTAGYGSDFCDEKQTCEEKRCLNGGICVRGHVLLNGTRQENVCACPDGYAGIRCEKRTIAAEACHAHTCYNKGRCIRGSDGRTTCKCPFGWAGSRCETRDDLDRRGCPPGRCRNGGVCSRPKGASRQACQCPPFFRGVACHIAVNPCSRPHTCFNSGVCTRRLASQPPFRCTCREGYSGQRCETRPTDPCVSHPCGTHGRCSVDSNPKGYICRCQPPVTGDNCQFRSEGLCLSSPCKNLGTCVETTRDSFSCRCLGGWTGRQCERWAGGRGSCPSDYCHGRGVCFLGPGGQPACRCRQAYGDRCEFTCSLLSSGMFAHPTQCSLYVTCVWGTAHVMQCPRRDLHFNSRLKTCDWASRAGCTATSSPREEWPVKKFHGFWFRLSRTPRSSTGFGLG